jgi:dTDP-glucose 4,6-dehydratase
MKLLVTGGAGFIGSNFVSLLASGDLDLNLSKITVLDKLTYAGDLEQIQPLISSGVVNFVNGDICNPKVVLELVSEHDTIINFAAESHVDNSIFDSREFIISNVLGVQNILASCATIKNRRFLQVSTDEVYGTISTGSWDEHFPLAPNSPYSASKAAADLLSLAMHTTHRLDVLVTRCSNNYGPRQHGEKLIPKLINLALANAPLTLYGDGSNIREWIFVEDHCRALALVLKKGISGEVYNIGSSNEFTNNEIADAILNAIPESTSTISYIQDRRGHDFRYSLNDEKLRNLGVLTQESFRAGIEMTVDWYKTKSIQKQNSGQ